MLIDTRSATLSGDVDISGPHACQTHWWARMVRKVLRSRVLAGSTQDCCHPQTVIGKEVFDHLNGPAIFIANRQGPMDIPMILTVLPESIKDNTYFGIPVDGRYMKDESQRFLQPWYQSLVLGHFPIIRGGGAKTLDYARALLQQGLNVCIFPEDNPVGVRGLDDSGLGEFRHGAAILAKSARVPIVPIVLQRLQNVASLDRPAAGPITILQPLRLSLAMGVIESTELLHRKMNAALASYRVESWSLAD